MIYRSSNRQLQSVIEWQVKKHEEAKIDRVCSLAKKRRIISNMC